MFLTSKTVKIPKISIHQRGAVLVLGVIVLFMLSLLAISSMNMSALQLRVAGNTQSAKRVFQVASATNQRIFNGEPINIKTKNESKAKIVQFTRKMNEKVTGQYDQTGGGTDDDITTESHIKWLSKKAGTNCPSGYSLEGLACDFYEIRTTATHTGSKATATVVHGRVEVAASPN